jgi:hypothetical protein
LPSVDLVTKEPADIERTDRYRSSRPVSLRKYMVAFVLAGRCLKIGGDAIADARQRRHLPARLRAY